MIRITIILIIYTIPSTMMSQMFTEQHVDAGVDHIFKHQGFIGGGACFFDCDNDGDQDLYLTGGADIDHFYINDGTGKFSNQTVTSGFGITLNFNTMGVISGDINNDGYKDLFVTTNNGFDSDYAPNLLFLNQQDGTFKEIGFQFFEDKVWSVSACFLDYNLDGLLDIYVGNYVENTGFGRDDDGNIVGYDHQCFENHLYRNNGDLSFSNVTSIIQGGQDGCTLAVMASDYDGDGDIDLLTANDFGPDIVPNQVLENQYPANQFVEVSAVLDANVAMYGMGISSGDFNADLRPDYYFSNLGNNVFLEQASNAFAQSASEYGILNGINTANPEKNAVSWGNAISDFDNDMDEDIFICNGYVPSLSHIPTLIRDQDVYFENLGDGQFQNVSDSVGITSEWVSRGVSVADIDNDGDLDIMDVIINAPMTEIERRSKLYLNNLDNGANWLKIKLTGTESNRDAYGAKVIAHLGSRTILRMVDGGSSFASQHSTDVHLGLGDNAIVDSIEVYWPGKTIPQIIYSTEANQTILITEENTVAINEVDLAFVNQIHITPNPASDHVRIEHPNDIELSDIKVYDILGYRVHDIVMPKRGGSMNISQLPAGVYLIEMTTGNSKITKRFCKI